MAVPPHPHLLHGFLDAAVPVHRERVAIDVPPGSDRPVRATLTYGELSRRSDAIAGALAAHVAGEAGVAILLPRSNPDLYAAQIGAMKAGAAYTCLDAASPDARMAEILADAAPAAVVTDTAGRERLRGVPLGSVPMLDAAEAAVCPSPRPTPPWLGPGSPAYMIYTSGTTGKPKGVMLEHAGPANLVASDLPEFGLGPGDRVAQGSSAAYDSSVEEIWLALATGATLVVMDDATARLGPDLPAWLRRERITVLCPPPTQLRSMACADIAAELPDLRLVYVGGEALPADVAATWSRGCRLVNGYGPTECSVTAVRGEITPTGGVHIGRPVPGLSAWVLDDQLRPVPLGEAGELCLGGVGLARGYRNDPDLTARRFPTHPDYGRIYRTGDLARMGADGNLTCHGRIDAQVKVRGHRIELEEVEAALAACPGVREAACRVQEEVGGAALAAHLVPADPAAPPDFAAIRAEIARRLPEPMAPARMALISSLPSSLAGKLNRAALPEIAPPGADAEAEGEACATELEARIAAAMATCLGLASAPGRHSDFFQDLGGDSLRSALLVSALRRHPSTASLAVRDIYEAPTPALLAHRAEQAPAPEANSAAPKPEAGGPPPVSCAQVRLVTLAQGLVLLAGVATATWASVGLAAWLLPILYRHIGLVALAAVAPLLAGLAAAAYAPISVVAAVAAKRLLIGRYRPMRSPVWSGFYLRHWIVMEFAQMIPWRLLEGTEAQVWVLRALGARIGRRVHIHRGVDLAHGGWDLLEIGDDATLSQECSLRLVDLDAGRLVIAPIRIGDGATLETRAGVAGGTTVEAGGVLAALSHLPPGGLIPAGERWDGVPARPAGKAPDRAALPEGACELSPAAYGLRLVAARALLMLFVTLPLDALGVALAVLSGGTADGLAAAIAHPGRPLLLWLLGAALGAPITVTLQALACRAMGPVHDGVLPRWSSGYIRVWLKAGLVQSAGNWLSGGLYWPIWLRAAGMRVGSGCEISTIIDVVPELVEIGRDTFFADGIYLAGPRIHQGVVEARMTRLGAETFLGNHAVIPSGVELPGNILLGVCTVADPRAVTEGSNWFGHPPFRLPRPPQTEFDRTLTHDPPPIRYWNRVGWELLRFALPVAYAAPASAGGALWMLTEARFGPVATLLWSPLAALAGGILLCALVLALKWLLLGRVKPGVHPLWSCWCSRWDFHYVAWGYLARPILARLEGTLLLVGYVRAMGARVGASAVLGPGFAQVVDPDMLTIGDGATVECLFQAHTFEDRVLKIDHVRIGNRATVAHASVMLYGAEVGEGGTVTPHSVVMKGERLDPGLVYEGVPTRPAKAGVGPALTSS